MTSTPPDGGMVDTNSQTAYDTTEAKLAYWRAVMPKGRTKKVGSRVAGAYVNP
jgi:hypothetical protein